MLGNTTKEKVLVYNEDLFRVSIVGGMDCELQPEYVGVRVCNNHTTQGDGFPIEFFLRQHQ